MEPSDIQEKIKQLMDTAGWSEYKLAKMANLPQSTISHLFNRNNAPTFTTVEAICRAFNITMGQFFADVGESVVLTKEQSDLLVGWGAMNEEQREIITRTIQQFLK